MKVSNCQNCGSQISLSYCENCGEKRFDKNSLSIFALLKHIFISITDIDGKFFTSIKLLIFKPGQLTIDYLNGVRKYRLYPFQLFIYINILYFFLVSLTHQDTFSTHLESHMQAENFFHADAAKSLVKKRLEKTGENLEEFRIKFDKKIDSYSKMLIFFMIPLFSLAVFMTLFRHRFAGIKSLIYATHFISMVLIVVTLETVVLFLLTWTVDYFFAISSSQYFLSETVFSLLILIWLLIYLYYSLQRVFNGTLILRLLSALFLVVTFYYSIIVYRALLFFITFYSIS